MTGKNCHQFSLVTWNSFIGQFVNPIEGGWKEGIVILARCKFHFIRENEDLVWDPSSNIPIVRVKNFLNTKVLLGRFKTVP